MYNRILTNYHILINTLILKKKYIMSKLTSQIEIYEYNKILAIFVLNNNSTSMTKLYLEIKTLDICSLYRLEIQSLRLQLHLN